MKNIRIVLLSAGLSVGLAACGGGGDSEDNSSGSASEPKEIFEQNCASCHGKNLQGKNGPKLANIGGKLSKEKILTQIQEGGGGMPGGLIEGKKAEMVASWLADKK